MRMIFNEDVVLRSAHFKGNKLASGSAARDRPIVLCRFGPEQSQSLVTISQTLDKLLVYDLDSLKTDHDHFFAKTSSSDGLQQQQQQQQQSSFDDTASSPTEQTSAFENAQAASNNNNGHIQQISIRSQVICSLEVLASRGGSSSEHGDLLLIGCTNSILVYATREQAHLSSVDTSAAHVAAILAVDLMPAGLTGSCKLVACAGAQKLYTFAATRDSLELSSERTISETVSCLAYGTHSSGLSCLVTGSRERHIKLYSIDAFDQNIQACELTLSESSAVSCLCAIETCQVASTGDDEKQVENARAGERPQVQGASAGNLPAITGGGVDQQKRSGNKWPQMSYLAYGLESGLIGVHHLLSVESSSSPSSSPDSSATSLQEARRSSIIGEPLWRHKSKQRPVSLQMFDLNGDGLDELIVGYRSGRLEARAPFTGQLLGATRLFSNAASGRRSEKSSSSSSGCQLVGMAKWQLEDESSGETSAPRAETKQHVRRSSWALVACSSSSALVVFRPRQRCAPEPLRDHLARSHRHLAPTFDRALARVDERQKAPPLDNSEEWMQAMAAAASAGAGPLELGIETRGDNTRAVTSDSCQSAQLMQRVGALSNDQSQLELRLTRLARELVQRHVAASRSELDATDALSAARSVDLHLSHCWDFDVARKKLRLTLFIDSAGIAPPHHRLRRHHLEPAPSPTRPLTVDMIELVDESDANLLEQGAPPYQQHLLIETKSTDDNDSKQAAGLVSPSSIVLWLNSEQYHNDCRTWAPGGSRKSCDWRKLNLRLFCSAHASAGEDNHHGASTAQRVHEQIVVLPPFAMLVPEQLYLGDSEGPTAATAKLSLPAASQQQILRRPSGQEMICLTFRLPEREHRLKVLDWMEVNFLSCTLHCDRQPSVFGSAQSSMSLAVRAADADRSSVDYYAESSDDQDLEFRFVDLRRGAETKPTKPGLPTGWHLRVRISVASSSPSVDSSGTAEDELTLESDDSDLLVELTRSLVLDKLQLSMQSHLLPADRLPERAVGALIRKLEALTGSSRQLEESENRIQTEIYESAELIKSLMQQFAISNQLNEFAISRDLLGEISMMLDRTQNSAQAYQLNNRSRQELAQEANRLREKIAFLTGACDL